MGRRPKMTVTSRFIDEQRPLASRNIPSPFPNPPPNREAIGRLSFRGPSPKMDLNVADFTQAISSLLKKAFEPAVASTVRNCSAPKANKMKGSS